jgi:hypothetical protein
MNRIKRMEALIAEQEKQKQEREGQAMADVRNAIGRLEAVIEEDGHEILRAAEMQWAKKVVAAKMAG